MRILLGLALAALCAIAQAQPLTPGELEQLARVGQERSKEAARAQFAGQGARIAEHYLRHTGIPPAPDAYFFVLEAVADAEAAIALVRGLASPPQPESGLEFESGGRRQRLPRYEGEIEVALEAVLSERAVARDPRVAEVLVESIAAMRARRSGMETRAIAVLGKCDSDAAREALRRLAADPEPQIRSAAVAGLGSAGAAPDAALLSRALLEDREPRARIEAAAAIAKLQAREALPALKRALAEERDPAVMDAVVLALAAFDALPADPAQCFDAAARSREQRPATLALSCWRRQASREALLQAAIEAPLVVRALALGALFERSAARDGPLVQFAPQRIAPPPPVSGARQAIAVIPPPAPAPAPPPAFDQGTRLRLLASAVEVLSQSSRAYYPRAGAISPSLAYPTNLLLLDLAGGDMRLALEYADRIVTPASRSVNDGRLSASYALSSRDARAYESVRRPRQALLAAGLALSALMLVAFRRTRAAALAAALPLAAWAAWSLYVGGVRELPPLELAPLTIVGSASITAALAAAAAAFWRGGGRAPGGAGALLTGLGATGVAAVAAFFVCGFARWLDVFPIGGEGWELIFDPIGAGLAALPLAALGSAGGAVLK